MPKKPRIIPPITYDPETGGIIWHKTKEFDPLDLPLNGFNDRDNIASAILKIMEDAGMLPRDSTLQVLLADQAQESLRVGDILGPILHLFGVEPYREMPPKRDIPPVVSRSIAKVDPDVIDKITSKYATLYMFIDEQLLKNLHISEIRAASYYAVLLEHFSTAPLEVVERLLGSRGGGVLGYNMRETLNWWVINGEALTDLYDSLCKQHGCKGDCDQTHIQGFDEKAVRLLAEVLLESTQTPE